MPIVEQNVNVCARNNIVLFHWIGGRGIFGNRGNSLFWGSKWTTVVRVVELFQPLAKTPSQPFCLWRLSTQDWNFLVYLVRLDASCQVPALSKSRVFFLNISWFGMNVMYLILSVEGETCNYSLLWLKIAYTAAVLVLYTVCVIEQVQGQHDWIMATGYSCHFMDQEKVNKQKRNNQKYPSYWTSLANKGFILCIARKLFFIVELKWEIPSSQDRPI